ncbi:MAG: hypothetical protein AB1641_27880 [Thermodesulfobacteriota bacterium]
MLNPDFHDMLSALCEENVEFLIVGAYALAAHGLPRATGDLDIWIRRSPENTARVWRALTRFGAPLFDLNRNDLETADLIFQVGIAPCRIDLLTSIDGVDFEEAWPGRKRVNIEGLDLAILGYAELIKNKKASSRPQDLADLAWLEKNKWA